MCKICIDKITHHWWATSSPGWAVSVLSAFPSYEETRTSLIILVALHWTLQYVHVSLILGSPEVDPALQVWPDQCWVEGKHHLPQPAGNIHPDVVHQINTHYIPNKSDRRDIGHNFHSKICVVFLFVTQAWASVSHTTSEAYIVYSWCQMQSQTVTGGYQEQSTQSPLRDQAVAQMEGMFFPLQHQGGIIPSSIPKEKKMVALWERIRVSRKLIFYIPRSGVAVGIFLLCREFFPT